MSRRLLLVLLVLYVVGVVLIAVWPSPVDRNFDGPLRGSIAWLQRHGLDFVTYDRVEFAANIVFFIPLGLLLAALGGRGRVMIAFATCVAVSLSIELGQALFLPARFASAGDVLANTVGAAIGAAAAAIASSVRRRRATR
jgi:VanZ family protein